MKKIMINVFQNLTPTIILYTYNVSLIYSMKTNNTYLRNKFCYTLLKENLTYAFSLFKNKLYIPYLKHFALYNNYLGKM